MGQTTEHKREDGIQAGRVARFRELERSLFVSTQPRGDCEGVREFAIYLHSCSAALRALSYPPFPPFCFRARWP